VPAASISTHSRYARTACGLRADYAKLAAMIGQPGPDYLRPFLLRPTLFPYCSFQALARSSWVGPPPPDEEPAGFGWRGTSSRRRRSSGIGELPSRVPRIREENSVSPRAVRRTMRWLFG
jgi:hypothetical protein